MDENVEEIFAEEETVNPVTYILESYGWYMFIAGIIIYWAYNKNKDKVNAYFKRKEEDEYSAKYHKDPDAIASRLAAQQAHAMKLQEKYKRDAEEYQKKVEEKEAKKRAEWLEKNGGNGGRKLGFKPEYNPLAGDSSRGYRPEKKSACSGGGCGK